MAYPNILYEHLRAAAEEYGRMGHQLSQKVLWEFLHRPQSSQELPGVKVKQRISDGFIERMTAFVFLEPRVVKPVRVFISGYVVMASPELSYLPVTLRTELVRQFLLRGLSARLNQDRQDPTWVLSATGGSSGAAVGILLGYETPGVASVYRERSISVGNNPLAVSGFVGLLPELPQEFQGHLRSFQWVMSHFLDSLYLVTGHPPPNVLIYLDK